MAGFIPGLLPTNHSQEKQFAQAYEDVLERYKDERDRVQKKTFTKWVNKHLIKVRKHITDLYEDLRDGHNLISLLEVLSGVTLPREKGRMRFHRLQNVQIALDFLKQRQVKLVNIRNDDITDGNPKLTLGLIWTIILHFQISEIYVCGESADLTAKEKLLLWSQQATEGYPGLRCTNFSSAWSDGRMFNALLHRYRPDLINMEAVTRQSNRENLEQAFEIAESLGVTRLLDAEDVDVPSPDEKSVITYVSSIYDAFPKIPEGGEGIAAQEVDQRWSEYQSRFLSLLQWSRQHTALMAKKNFPQNPVELKALYNEYIHFKETEIPSKETEKSHIEHLYKLLEVWIEFGRIKLPPGLHPNDLEEEWGKLILEMLEREKALRPAVERVELLLQRANKIQNTAVDCEEKLTLAKNTLQADASRAESGEAVQCEGEMACYLQDCEALIRQIEQDLKILREEKYYQVDQLAFRVNCLQEELVSLRLQCSSVYRKGHFSQSLGPTGTEPPWQRATDGGLSLGQTLLGAVGAVGVVGAALLRRPMARSQLVGMSSSEDEGSLRFIYELLGWVEETQELLEGAEWGADLPSVENNLQEHNTIHTAVEELLSSLQEARSYEAKVSPNYKGSYSETLAKLEYQYCKLLEHSSCRLQSLESLHAFVSRCTEELIWLNEREEEEISFDWSDANANMSAKRELYEELRLELAEKQDVMRSIQETAGRLCQENHPAKQTVEAYSAALQTQWQWVEQLCVCVEQHLKDNTAYFQYMSDARDCESYLRQLQETIKRQYTCDKNSRLSKLEDLLQDSMEEKEQLIEYRSTVAGLVGRAKTVVQLRPRSAESPLGGATPIRAICDYKQIETNVQITINRGEECVLEDNSQRTKWKVISPTGNEAMVPSVCFTVPPPNQEAIDTSSRAEQLYQKVMSLWHQLHVNMKSVVTWHYVLKDIRSVSGWTLDSVRSQSPSERQQLLDHMASQLADFLSDSRESSLFTAAERRELERDAQQAQQHCQDLLLHMETVEKDESVSQSYLSELQDVTLRLDEAERRLMRAIETPPPSRLSSAGFDNTLQIAEQEKLQSELDSLRCGLGDVSRRCVRFFEEKPSSSSVPVLRSQLSQAVERTDRLHNLSALYLEKLKTVDVLTRSLDEAESQVRKYENRLSEEDIVPADTGAIQNLRDQLERWQAELSEQEETFQALQVQLGRAKEAGAELGKLHVDRSPELERYQERANQMAERWSGVKQQTETRWSDLEVLGSALQQYRQNHSALIRWIEETTERQERAQAGQTDSRALSEQLAQQTALVAEIEQNQTKLDECQTYSKQYCTSVKDYELQLMTYRAFVESMHKSPVKRRRMHSSSDAITQEFMDLRTRYTALVTLTTQHVKYISDALRRLEEEEKEVEEEKQARVGQVSELLGWVKGLRGRTGGPSAESSLAAQQAISEQLAGRKEQVAEAIRSTQGFLCSKQASKLSPEERAAVEAQLDDLTATYNQLLDSSTQQLQQLEQQLAREEERKNRAAIGGVIDLGTVETFSVFQAAQRGLIDQDTCSVLLEAQLVTGGLVRPDSSRVYSLDRGLTEGLIDAHTCQSLAELESAMELIKESVGDQKLLPVAAAMESGLITEEVGLRILELQINSGGLRDSCGKIMSLEQAEDMRVLPSRILNKLYSRIQHKELLDPNTAEKVSIEELKLRCIPDDDSGLLLLPVKQQPGGTVCLRSGRKVGIFRAVQEGLIDRAVTVRLLEAQLFAGGISDPRSSHRLTVGEAVRHGLMDQDLACAMLARQLQNGGILDPLSRQRLDLEESIRRDLLSPRLALLVLESLWTFTGLLWPESGELMPIAEALQQGVISGDLARNILRQRHTIGGLYSPETLKVLPLNQAAEKDLEPDVVRCLRDIHIPDVFYNMNQSGTPSLNRLSWGSTSSSSPTSFMWEASPTDRVDPEVQAKDKLLFHLMTHSYVDAHSGKRLVLLDQDLVLVVKDSCFAAGESSEAESSNKLAGDKLQTLGSGENVRMPNEAEGHCSDLETSVDNLEMMNTSDSGKDIRLPQKLPETTNRDGLSDPELSVYTKVHKEKEEGSSLQSEMFSWNYQEGIKYKANPVGGTIPQHLEVKDTITKTSFELEEGIKSGTQQEQMPKVKESKEVNLREAQEFKGTKSSPTDLASVSETVVDFKGSETVVDESLGEEQQEDTELERLVLELKQGGLMTEDGEKLLPDEAVAQGVLPGHAAVKLMAQAGLFGGFLDATSGESLSLEEVMQEGLLDEDLMWGVLKSDKTLAGVVDIEKGQICGVRDAAQAGLIDPNTAARLLEAQVASGGIVDLRRDKKVSVTLAANLGLIEEDQREELIALEKAFKGKVTDSATSLRKASLQLQMEGVVDPESKSTVPLEQAIKKGLIRSDEAYQVLARQVAEGGIIHHASGMRLSVSDAVDRGLVDRSIAPGLEELEWIYRGKISASTKPEAITFQAKTGAILDPDNGVRLTLTEAVSKGLLDDKMATEVMASPVVTQGTIDPKTAQIVPYSELVSQGKIDIETGKRFLEVKPFQGVQDKQTLETLTLPEAVALKWVDPVPAVRLLQSQADTGGIIDIYTGERLPLPEASARGLVSGDMVKEIATNQFVKGGLVDPATGQRVSDLSDAITSRLLTRDLALEIQETLKENFPDHFTTVIATGPRTDSQTSMSAANIRTSSGSPSSVSGLEVTHNYDETFRSEISDQSLLHPEDEMVAEMEPERSMDLLSKFASNVEKRIQQAIQEILPQKLDNHHQQEPSDKMENEGKQGENLTRGFVKESTRVITDHTEEVQKEDGQETEKDEYMECGSTESTVMVHHGSEDVKSEEIIVDRETKDPRCFPGFPAENEDLKSLQTKSSTDVEQSDQFSSSTSKESDNKSKKKRKSKKKARGKEVETETHLPEMKHDLQTHHTSPETKEIPKVAPVTTEEITLDANVQKSDSYLPIATDPSSDERMERTEEKVETENVLVDQEQEAVLLEPNTEMEEDATRTILGRTPEKVDMKVEEEESVMEQEEVSLKPNTEMEENEAKTMLLKFSQEDYKQEEVKKEFMEKALIARQLEAPEVQKSIEAESLTKSSLKEDEKAALILKAKESILKKVFEKGVSEKQAAQQLEALRKKKQRKTGGKKTETNGEEGDADRRSFALPKDHKDQVTVKKDPIELQRTPGEIPAVQETLGASSSENIRAKQKDVETLPTGSKSKRSKKSKKLKPTGDKPEMEKAPTDLKDPKYTTKSPPEPESDGTVLKEYLKVSTDDDQAAGAATKKSKSLKPTKYQLELENVTPDGKMGSGLQVTKMISKSNAKQLPESRILSEDLNVSTDTDDQSIGAATNKTKSLKPTEMEKVTSHMKDPENTTISLAEPESDGKVLTENVKVSIDDQSVGAATTKPRSLKPSEDQPEMEKATSHLKDTKSAAEPELDSIVLTEDMKDINYQSVVATAKKLKSQDEQPEVEKLRPDEKVGSDLKDMEITSKSGTKQQPESKILSEDLKVSTDTDDQSVGAATKEPKMLTKHQPEVEKLLSVLIDPKYMRKSPAEPESNGTVLTEDMNVSPDDDQSVGVTTKEPKSEKPAEDQPELEKITSDGKVDSDLKDIKITSGSDAKQPESRLLSKDLTVITDTDVQSVSDPARPSDVGKANQKDPEGGKSLQKSQTERAAGLHLDQSDLTDLSQEVSSKQERKSLAQPAAPDPHSEKSKRKENLQPPAAESSDVSESLTNLQQHLDSPETAALSKEDASIESESLKVTEVDLSNESLEDEEKVSKNLETLSTKEKAQSTGSKSSLLRQECLEHDQRIIALLSMVRHVEVRLKQQQQSVGRSLVTLDGIINRTETLDLELSDLEPEIKKEVEAAERLLKPRPTDVPPQLLLALEKDGRSLARAYEVARSLSESVLQSLRNHRDSCKDVVAAEQKSLGQHVDRLLSWLSETEAQMDRDTAGKDGDLCKELQSSLSTCSDEVSSLVSDIQLFISERAQDLAPEQSRRLLEQLQQLQTAFHHTSSRAEAWAGALSAQRGREEEERRRQERRREEEEEDRERKKAREREVVQQQKAECSQKLEGLNAWLAGASGLLASQRAGPESGDVSALQERQKKLKEMQRNLQAKADGVAQAVRSVEEFMAEKGDNLSAEEKKNLQVALERLKEQYGALTDSTNTSLSELDDAISTTVQQNTQRAKAVEELQETQSQIDSLLSSFSQLDRVAAPLDVLDSSVSPPEGAVESHTEMLQSELQQLQAQQAQLLQISQSTRSLLEQPDSTVPPEEKQRLRAALDRLQAQHQDRLHSCQERLRKSEALQDELTKFLQEHGNLGAWLELSEQELRSLGEGETDAQGLKDRLEEHRKLGEDVICHKADLRFVSISGQKVLDSVQGALEQAGGSDPALDGIKRLVSDKLQDTNHRYTTLHTKSTELGGRLGGLLERYQQYQDEVVSIHSWLSAHEQNQSTAKSSGDTDPQNLQNSLRQVQLLQDELAERSVQLEKVKRAGRDLVSADESPSLKAVDILCAADGLEKRFGSLSTSVSERAEQLQTAVAQSVSVQEGLKGLLGWLDQLVLNPGPVQPTAQAVQDALTQNQKLRQELLSRQGSVEATRDAVPKLLQSSDASSAPGLHSSLDDLTRRYAAAQSSQAEREAQLKGLLPWLESYERLSADLQAFTQSRLKALSPAGHPDRSVHDYRQTVEEVKSELEQEAGQLKSFRGLGAELSQSRALSDTQNLLENVKDVTDEFTKLEENVNERFAAIQACEQQLHQFRGLSGSLVRWLQTAQDQLPSKEANLNTEGLQRRVQQLQDLLNDWESQGSRIQDLNKTGSELESLIIDVTAPQTKTGVPQINGSAGPSSVNGIHTCKGEPSDLTELQVTVSDVNARYDALGSELKERLGRQQASLELQQKARQNTEELRSWLSDREKSLTLGQTTSPSKPEVVRAQAQQNKALLSELAEHSGKVEELKSTLRKLIADNPDSPEADGWRQQLQEIDSRWQTANQTAAQRQTELETCADRLGSFASAANQLGPWLREKELMMSVLGPLSIDPNMLNTQKQQVQFMLREFDTRRPQFDQLTQSAEGILSQTGDSAQDPKDLEEVQTELGSISQQWEDLTGRLTQRSSHIDQAQGTSEKYQALLKDLSSSIASLSERLDAQASLSAQPEALKLRLQETGEIRSELERRRGELSEAERLCGELSAIVAEPYLKEELSKRLESVSAPLRSLEERAADGLTQLQAALSSTQQFQQMFKELRSWLDRQSDLKQSPSDSLPCRPEAIRSLLAQTEELQRGVASQRGSYELIQAEGVSLLATLPADERAALQARLASLRQDWEGVNQRIAERETRLKNSLGKAETYQQHRAELTPWLAECEQKDGEVRPSLDPSVLDESLQKARALTLDLERRQPLLEAFNTAADQLLELCCIGEEELRDEKAQLNRRVDRLSEDLLNRTSQLEELASRLKEFEDGRQAVERRLEAAKHQIEVQEALGPQACSAKSLERLRSQQENMRSLQPQVVYLKDLAQGLVQDAPQTPGGSTEGTQRLQEQAKDTEKEYDEVTDKIELCCSSLESRLQGVGEVQSHVRDVFSRLADLDDELDSLSPVGRDADSLASQADAVKSFLSRLSDLRTELEGHAAECTAMLRREGSSPDLLALRRETEALSRQAGKLSERGQARLVQIEDAAERVQDFYRLAAELQAMLGKAEEGLNSQGAVGTEVEMIKQQLQEFKAVEREQVDGIQPKLQHVNAVGQGLIQSAAKHTDTQALEHDLETTNLRWNSLNKRVAERIAQLQEALLHCGKFQDALEPLLSWLSDTEELVANQRPPSAEYRVVKAQIQEQKLLQRLLDDRRPTVEMIRAEGARIAATADSQDREKIQVQLQSLSERWSDLLDKASGRQRQLEELQVLALQFHEALEPLGEWLSTTERRLSSAEPMGTQTAKITQQIVKHKALQEDVSSREAEVDHLESLSQSLFPLSCSADRDWLRERLGAVRSGHSELAHWCAGRAALLDQALANARLFGEEEVEVLNWLAEVAQRLGQVSVQSYQPQLLAEQHKHTLALNEEILSRKKTVDQAIKNGQALLKQTTGEEVLLIQEKLDGIKSRYAEMTAGSSKALRTLEQALQLSTRFAAAHDDLNQWLDGVEAELSNVEPDASPAYQERQKELKKVSAEKRLVLDTVNEVGNALLDLVPWRAREGLDRLVADANQRYRHADETITQRVQLVQAAIQRSQQYEEAVDAELAWVGETERKLASLGPLSLEPDVTVAQLQVQRAFNIDIIRHKDTVDQLLSVRDEVLEACSDAQKDALMVKTDSLSSRYDTVSQSHSERFSALEQAQVLVARFWETYEELEPWLGETEALITQLPPPAIDTDALRLQQDQMRLLRESIAEHKPHIDKLLKIGPQLAELSLQEGATVTQRYTEAERRYLAIKEEVKDRAGALDEAVSQSAQLVEFHDKMDPLLETLEAAVQRLRQPPPVAAEVEKIREQLAEHRAQGLELDKLLPSFSALCSRGEELISRAAHDDPAAQAVRSRLLRLRSLWDEIRQRAEERESKLNDVLDLAGKFWADVAALLSTLRDSQDIVRELEDPGVDPSLIKQQIEAAEAIKAETDGLREELEFVRTLGADLIFACGETEKPEVKKTIDEMNAAWESLNRTWRERMERLEEAMTASVQYQDALQSMFDYLDNAVIKLCDMSTVGTDLGTVKQQIEELKHYKVDVYQQQIDMEKLCHQGELLLKKVSDQTDRDMIQEPLTELRHLWENLGDKITKRQHKLEAALLALGQFQHALSELQAWLSHTHTTLDTQRPVSSDPKAIEIELAKHHVLRNDVLSHHATVETVNSAAAELLESSPGDEASHLRDQLDQLNRSWESLLLKTQERQTLLEAALQQAEGFHGELEEFLQWLRRTESQLSAAKPTGGLPETAREQLQQHMELQAQLNQRAEQYHHLLDQGESMLLARGGEEAGPGTTQTQQNLAMLQNKWASLNTKMDDRRGKLEEAVSLATGFQTSLQDTMNWLTQAEQTLNMAQPPSLILDTVLFQIDEHKVFVNEVNTHREQVLALEKAGSQLRFASLKQDVVLIKNLLLSVQARWDKLVQRSLDRGRHLDEARKRAKQFHEAWRKLTDWLEEAEKRLDSEVEISNEPDKIKVQLTKHKEFQKALGSKQPVYDTTVRSGKAMRDKAQLPADQQKLDHLVGEVRDKWDTVCGKSVERQHKLEEALLFSGQFAEALQALVDWLYRVEPQLAEDQPVHGDMDLVSNLMDAHKVFQKELGKRTGSVQALKRSARDLMETGRDDTAWVKVQLQELSNRWDTVCALSVTKQTRLQQALKQAEEFRTAVQMLLEWLSEAEQTLRFRGVLPEEAETLQPLLHTHRDFMGTVEEKRADVNKAAGMGEAILTVCHPDSITTIKHWITIIRARFEEVLTWAKQHEQRLETALTEVLNNANLLEELLSWLQWAETTLVQRDTEPLPQDIPQLKTLITEHQTFMEEMTRKQPDVDKVTKSYKRKPAEPPSSLAERRGARKHQQQQPSMQLSGGNPRLNQLCARWQQVWLLALDRQRKLNDALDRQEELKEFANFDFDVWRKKYMRWMNHKKSRVMDFFRRIDKDQDGKITRQEFIDGILASKFPTSKLEMSAVADIFDRDGDGYIDYYEFVAALHPNKDAYRPTTDADKIEDEVTRQVAQCKCAKRFQVEQIGENKYRFFLGNQFGDSQQLRLVRILRSTVMVRVGGGWMALDEFLVKNDPCRVKHPGLKILRSDSSSSISSRIVTVTPGYFCCRARGRTNLELREKFILPEGASQGLAAFRSRGRRSKPGSRNASPTRSSSSASHSGASLPSAPSTPATPTASASSRSSLTHSRDYAKPWLAHSKTPTPSKCHCCPDFGHNHSAPGHEGAASGSKLKRPTFHSSRGSLTGENGGTAPSSKRTDPKRGAATASGPTSRAGSRAGSRASSRRGSDASDASELQDSRSVCSDTSDTPRRPGSAAKPSKIPTISKKAPSPKTPGSAKK
ncbi:microtubule-actin cross-linking factor 1 isoform X17 [Xiphophorus hellerii]|uniref:microtubule-actin cross-linking factor 1 isoform X17 n=1 Tax=Xiphophorus hellerii TaxID=8084 RepID=UPI0013B392FE|nr:microtubule-actin cross-linking factor 1-like isoform X17 [Xiphophorus hellerii]